MAPRASRWRSHTFATNSATVRSEAATKMTSSQTTAAPLLQNEHEMEMEMDPVALMRGDGPEERWEAISDLDAFFSRVYEYFHERGLRCILASRIISLLSLAFTIALTVFLFELLNLEGLVNDCRDEESCSNHTRVPVVRPTMRGSPFVWLYVLPIFSCYWLWTLRHFVKDLRPLLEMRDFYRDRLQIDDDELHNIAWDAVVQRIVELNDRTRLCIVKEQLTPHDIANRILRKENFMVAFVNRDLLPLQWPPPLSRFDFLTKTLEWNLYLCILDAMFDGDFKVRRSFTQDVHGVRRLQFNFMVVGALNALAFPFIAVVMLVHFFIEHFEELCAARNSAQFRRNSGEFSDRRAHAPRHAPTALRPPQANAHFGELYLFESHLCFDLKVFAFHKQWVLEMKEVVAFLRSESQEKTVDVEGKGYSYELHIPDDNFDEAIMVMEALRLQARNYWRAIRRAIRRAIL